jgi:hypothetical protein
MAKTALVFGDGIMLSVSTCVGALAGPGEAGAGRTGADRPVGI